ncbi:MAG: ABC transporter, permease protein 1 (cluster 1, maltose/g3p/polyamine/iron), partial [uncultured Nocardioides sp.]
DQRPRQCPVQCPAQRADAPADQPGSRPGEVTRAPYAPAACPPAADRPGPRPGARLPPGAPGGPVLPGLRAGPAVRSAAGVGGPAELSRPRHRPLPVGGDAPVHRVLPRQRCPHDGDRSRPGAADAAHGEERAPPGPDRAAPGLGDAGRGEPDGLAVALRHAVRRGQLPADPARRRLHRALLVAEAAVLLLRG